MSDAEAATVYQAAFDAGLGWEERNAVLFALAGEMAD